MKKHRENIFLADKLTLTFLRSCIIVRIARLKTTGKKSCPKVNECPYCRASGKEKNGGNKLIGLTALLPI